MGCCGGFIGKVFDTVSNAVEDVGSAIVDTVESIVENPTALATVALSVAAPGVGTAIGSALGASGAAATAIGNAVIGGTLAEASGGDFAKGALTAGAGSLLGTTVAPSISNAIGGTAGQIIAPALTSGAMAELTGGDFTDAAIAGAVGGGINAARTSAILDYIQQNPLADDYTVKADYSLSSGASGEPGLTYAPTTTEYQVGSFDYSLGDLLNTLGLTTAQTPNIDSIGGGQGLVLKTNDGYITESGFVPNTYISSLGDPNSFINSPVIDTGLSYDELQNTSASDLNAKLAGLDVAKALTPFALAALMKSAYDTATSDSADGFAMVPVPSDWKSPEYNMAFTPSAPVDFGSPDLLKGTQWENTMDLGSLINTINNQSSVFNTAPEILQQFNQPYTVGVNDQIGNLNGSPVSISDIIAGIQSQYGQTPTSTMG